MKIYIILIFTLLVEISNASAECGQDIIDSTYEADTSDSVVRLTEISLDNQDDSFSQAQGIDYVVELKLLGGETYTFETLESEDFDPVLTLLVHDQCENLIEHESNDDSTGNIPNDNYESFIEYTTPLRTDGQYLLLISGLNEMTGTTNLEIKRFEAELPEMNGVILTGDSITGCHSMAGSYSSHSLFHLISVLLLLLLIARRFTIMKYVRTRIAHFLLYFMLLGSALSLLAPASASAELNGFSVMNFRLALGTNRIISLETAGVPDHLNVYGGTSYHYASQLLQEKTISSSQTQERSLLSSQTFQQFGVGIGLFDLVALEFNIPVIYTNQGDETLFPALGTTPRGDSLARLRFLIAGSNTGAWGLSGSLATTLPTGDSAGLTGDEGVQTLPTLTGTHRHNDFITSVSLGALIRTETDDNVRGLSLGQEMTYGIGTSYQWTDSILSGVEFVGRSDLSDFTYQNPLEVILGSRIGLWEQLFFEVGGGAGLISGYGTPLWRTFAALQWHPESTDVKDQDQDGILDQVDQCPLQPEDRDEFEDEDGCPDPDNDQDQILDQADQCPLKAEDKDGFEDDNGCPDLDNDQDQILDQADQCPLKAEDIDEFEDGDGCPDLDNDQDQILDPADQCPLKAEDKDGFEDTDGCPDLDNDQDGVPDSNDKCPLKAEDGIGDTPKDGCPSACRISIPGQVLFANNSAELKKSSYIEAQKIVDYLKTLKNFKEIIVEGHTDNVGFAYANLRLSRKRAKRFAAVLRQKIKNSTISIKAVGFGFNKPIASNDTPEGRAKNRRVSFRIIGGVCK